MVDWDHLKNVLLGILRGPKVDKYVRADGAVYATPEEIWNCDRSIPSVDAVDTALTSLLREKRIKKNASGGLEVYGRPVPPAKMPSPGEARAPDNGQIISLVPAKPRKAG